MMRDLIANSCIKMEVYLHANGGMYEYFSILTDKRQWICYNVISLFLILVIYYPEL